MRGHGHAEVGGDERGFDFFERLGGQLGRARDDALDFVRELGVRFLQAGFEFGEEIPCWIIKNARMTELVCGGSRGVLSCSRDSVRGLKFFDVFVRQFDRADERLVLLKPWQSEPPVTSR